MEIDTEIGSTKEMKLKHWGPGEWVDEPDLFQFEHEGFKCAGSRSAILEGTNYEHLSGGYWCAYVQIPEGHPWCGKDIDEIDADVHGGITLAEKWENQDFWVGFDCAHSNDIVPSLIETMSRIEKDMNERIPNLTETSSRVFKRTYRNHEFVVNEVKSLAEQAKKAQEQHGS